MDLHRNLFYSYRGPSLDEGDRERQLENNLTKALINTLELGGEAVWRPFLTALGLAEASGAAFLLQRRDLPSGGAANKPTRVLLGLSKRESAWKPGETVETIQESLPDGWVYGNSFAVLVESKVDDNDFLPGQMQAHLARLESGDGKPPTVILRTWGQVHRLFSELLPKLTAGTSSHLLVTQFIQFLEYSGMGGFTGFRREHFDYFVLHDDDDARRWVRDQMEGFAAKMLANLQKVAPFYESFGVGKLKSSHSYCWVAFGPKNYRLRPVTHQTVTLAPDGVRVLVNTELKRATDRLKAVVKRSPDALRAELQAQHKLEPFDLVLEERVPRQASDYTYIPRMRLNSSMLTDEATCDIAWIDFAETVGRLPLPYFRIERLIPLRKLLDFSEGDPLAAIQYVVNMFQRNHSVVMMLNR